MVYEINRTDKIGAAIGLIASLLNGKFNLGIGSTAHDLGNFTHFKNTALDTVYSVLQTNSCFKAMHSPTLRIQSGACGVFAFG